MAGPSIPRGLKDNGDRPLFRRSGPNPDGKDNLSDRIRFYLLEFHAFLAGVAKTTAFSKTSN
mgnify:CR=1 FL=1